MTIFGARNPTLYTTIKMFGFSKIFSSLKKVSFVHKAVFIYQNYIKISIITKYYYNLKTFKM